MISWVKGINFKPYYSLLLEADPNLNFVKQYLKNSYVALYKMNNQVVGILVLQPKNTDFEIMNLAVKEAFQGQKIAQKLIQEAIRLGKLLGANRLFIATGTTGMKQLYLYQKMKFRFYEIQRDFFTLNYPEIIENNLLLQDKIILDLPLSEISSPFTIRLLTEKDEKSYRQFLKETCSDDATQFFSQEMVAGFKKQLPLSFAEILQVEQDQFHLTKKGTIPQKNYYFFQNNVILGRLSMTETLTKINGHIAYYLAPFARRKQFGQYLLAFALNISPIDSLLILVDEMNLPSRKLIENFGGKYLTYYSTENSPVISYEIKR